MAKSDFTKTQYTEIIIIITIILIVIYRVALVYDFVPDQYQPSTIIDGVYNSVKNALTEEATQTDAFGQTAKWTLDHIKAVETYVKEQQARYAREEQTAERCHENMIFRYFNFMGDEDNPNCSEQNLQLQHAVQDISNTAHPGSAPTTPTTQPSAPAPTTPTSAPATGG